VDYGDTSVTLPFEQCDDCAWSDYVAECLASCEECQWEFAKSRGHLCNYHAHKFDSSDAAGVGL